MTDIKEVDKINPGVIKKINEAEKQEDQEFSLEVRMKKDGQLKWHIPQNLRVAGYMLEILTVAYRELLRNSFAIAKPTIDKPRIFIPGLNKIFNKGRNN